MRERAAAATSEATRQTYLLNADRYEALAQRPTPALTGSALAEAQLKALQGEVQIMHDRITVLQHALSVVVMLLTRNLPAAAEDLARVQLEPSPDTPADKVAAVRQMTERVREILGSTGR